MTKKYLIILGLIIIVGIFLRTYNHHDWLHFELDQSRDALIISYALENGITHLPLVGPPARGSDLHLGPLFYYFQYTAGALFGNTAHIFAWPDLFFGILTIPLFYLLARQFFDRRLSLMLTAIVATSLFFITYSRFAWNPNALPFWVTLLSLSLLKITAEELSPKRIWWFGAGVVSVIVMSQLHFLALIVAILVTALFLLINRFRSQLKEVVVGIVLIGVLCAPIFVSETRSDWRNTQAFFSTVTEKNDKDAKHDLVEKTFRAYQKTSTFYWVTLTGDRRGGDMILTRQKNPGYLTFLCDKKCRQRLPSLAIAMVAFLSTLSIFGWHIHQTRTQKSTRRKNILIILWLAVSALAFIPLAYQLSIRFFLILLPSFVILLGFVLLWIQQRLPRHGKIIVSVLISVAIISNLMSVSQDFAAYSKAQTQAIDPPRDLVLKRTDRVTLAQLERVAGVIHERDTLSPVIMVGDNLYVRALHYLLVRNFADRSVGCHVKRSAFESDQTPQSYYLLTRTESEKQLIENFEATHDLTFDKSFGTLRLYELATRTPVDPATPLPPDCHRIK